ncbi:hypothetical protein X989_4705 [Burkholderia pseudomallei MSHR4378]|nr:hypothetical protein X989_4705 [Burkholderia pseudomallei MSHR4378]KGS25161.1 hypothetical protein X941_4824 [Burkholderia pseudomallei MSHR5569]
MFACTHCHHLAYNPKRLRNLNKTAPWVHKRQGSHSAFVNVCVIALCTITPSTQKLEIIQMAAAFADRVFVIDLNAKVLLVKSARANKVHVSRQWNCHWHLINKTINGFLTKPITAKGTSTRCSR